ncbi:MAG: HIT family protein [Bacilli bacterium]
MNCLFCDIAKDKNKRLTIYEDELVIVLMDKYPICDGHLLVIPREHFVSIYDVPEEILSHMFNIAKKYAKITMASLDEKGCSFSINYGSKQEIKHLHLHIMPDFNKKPSKKVEDVYKLVMEGVNEKKSKEEN